MKKLKPPIWISVFLIILSVIIFVIIFKTNQLTLEQKISSGIAIFSCLGALIAAVFVVFAYMQTAWASVESQRPHLLVQVTNENRIPQEKNNPPLKVTAVHYKNTSGNQFTDLSIELVVKVENRRIDLSDLFFSPMIMPGYDQRTRRFESIKTLSERGVDLQKEASQGNLIVLQAGYSYTFQDNKNIVKSQRYKWNPLIQEWEIW